MHKHEQNEQNKTRFNFKHDSNSYNFYNSNNHRSYLLMISFMKTMIKGPI
jgi:hypothetical protein